MLLIFGGLFVYIQVDKYETRIKLQSIDIKDRSEQIQQLQIKFDKANEQINNTLQQKDLDTQKLQQLEQERENLRKQLEDTQKALQAKIQNKERSTIALSGNASAAAPAQATAPSGTCSDWIRQAGVDDPGTAYWLIMKESGCRPTAQNPSSTAYGIGQFLNTTWAGVGCKKSSDPVYQIQCMQKYVKARYGSWAGAKSFWVRNHHY